MEFDGRRIPDGGRVDADVCIIGAGPAGLALAAGLAGGSPSVLLLESGGEGEDHRLSDLNDGAVAGDAYADLHATRHRGVGGTTRIWNTPVLAEPGAKYVPLDAIDFEERPRFPLSGWPFDRSHLEPYYRRAREVCGIGPFGQEAHGSGAGLTFAGDALTTGIYQLGTTRRVIGANLERILASHNVRLVQEATVCALATSGVRADRAHVKRLEGNCFDVHAKVFVLAAGAIENARILLVSGIGVDGGPGSSSWVGRGFMEHPRDQALRWVPRSPSLIRAAAFFDARRHVDGHVSVGRACLTDAAVRQLGINATIMLFPRLHPPSVPAGMTARVLERLRSLGRRPAPEGFGWSNMPDPEEVYGQFVLLTHLEQRPHPENRVTLGATRDAFGVPRVILHWRWREEDQASLERLRRTIAAGIEGAELGKVEVRPGVRPDPNAHHHAGTTRMHGDPRFGVVDADGRVHGTDNLYATGASVFPTAGFANPTLTVVALALRLADHLRQRI